jgi:ribokinase
MKKILVIGSINTDFVVKVDSMPRAGETLLGSGFSQVCGGKGANQAFACGRLGASVEMLGAVGEDALGEACLRNLQSAGVQTGRIRRCGEDLSGIALITVDASGENSIVVVAGANSRVDIPYLEFHRAALEACDLVILQLEIPMDTVVYAARLAKELGKTVLLDPAPAAPLPEELLRCVDYIKPNETELAALTGLPAGSPEEVHAAALALLRRGVGCVTATLGGTGAAIVTHDCFELLPAPRVKAVDTTAAGDSFTAALAVGLSEGLPLREAAAFGIRVSACAVTRPGAQSSIPDRAELAAFYAQEGAKGHDAFSL